MIHFLHKEAFFLAIPLLFLGFYFFRKLPPLLIVIRVFLLTLFLIVLAEPYLTGEEKGHDYLVLVDQSRSIQPNNMKKIEETLEQLRSRLKAEDRVGVISFGRNALIETPITTNYRYHPISKKVDVEGTDIGQAIQRALSMLSQNRSRSLLLFSDGEHTGGTDPLQAARESRRNHTRIDTILLAKQGTHDLSVEEITTPASVSANEQFQFSAFVRSEIAINAPVKLFRDGQLITEQNHSFRPGLNRILFYDRFLSVGIHRYQVEVPILGDVIPENNRAQGVVRVAGPVRILCITPKGREDRLTRSLQATGLHIVISTPQEAPTTLDALDGFRSVILENIPAEDLPPQAMETLQKYVTDLGGGLFMTGGRSAFGLGGYYQSPIEEISPVSFEIRPEQRKFALAMAIAMDNSGSMGVPISTGEPKMALANQGAIQAIKLLSKMDEVTVMSVDTKPNVMVPLMPLTNSAKVINQVQNIGVGGGGIYMDVALHAAAEQLAKSTITTKHIVLFADAADAEQGGDYKTFIPELVKKGITVSVIGMGAPTDKDAYLLIEIATLGKGRIFFAQNPKDLPRIFAQETIEVAHSSFLEGNTSSKALSELATLGAFGHSSLSFPTISGYTLAYRKPGAQVGLLTTDEQTAPLLAYWQHGLGKVSTFLGEVDGLYSGSLATWPEFATFFTTIVTWTTGHESQGLVFPEMTRQGHEATIRIELTDEQTNQVELEASLRHAKAKVIQPNGSTKELSLKRISDRQAEVRFPLNQEGAYYGSLEITENGKPTVYRLTPVTLSYSPEFEQSQNPQAGETLLRKLSSLTGGTFSPPIADILKQENISKGIHFLNWILVWFLLGFFLLEIVIRRFHIQISSKFLLSFQQIYRISYWLKHRFFQKKPTVQPSLSSTNGSSTNGSQHPENLLGSEQNLPISFPQEITRPEEGVSSALAKAKAKTKRL